MPAKNNKKKQARTQAQTTRKIRETKGTVQCTQDLTHKTPTSASTKTVPQAEKNFPTKTAPTANTTTSNEDPMELAMEFKLNARNTSWDDKDNTRWLLEAGYSEEEITEEIKTKFKKRYSYFFTRYVNNAIPEEEQVWHAHWLRKIDVSQDLLGFLPKALALFPSSKEDTLYTSFERIRKTSIKQRLLCRIGTEKKKDMALINSVYDNCIKFFQDLGLARDFGFDLDYTLVHALFTDDDSDIKFQDPHTDYPYVITRRNLKDRVRLSWTAHLPITPEGSWITLWWGPGVGYTVHIPYGKILLLRSDIIHGGGIPNVSRKSDKSQFRRLHFYLVTHDQAATPGFIYETYYDNETRLTDMCFRAKRYFNTTT
jgi:hypothetical protein